MEDEITYHIKEAIRLANPSFDKETLRGYLMELLPEILPALLQKYSAKETEINASQSLTLHQTGDLTYPSMPRLWQDTDQNFYTLYEKLDKALELKWDIKDLSAVFLGKGPFSGECFKWPKKRSSADFAYVFGELGYAGKKKKKKKVFIKTPDKNYWSYICKIFQKWNGDAFDARTLSSQYSQLLVSEYVSKELDKILSEIIKK